MISRKGVTPVEWCKCNQYEIALKPRRVPVILIDIANISISIFLPQVGQPGLRGNHTKGPGEKYLDYLVGK